MAIEGVDYTFRKMRASVQTQPSIRAIDKNVATLIVALDGTGDFDNVQAAINNLPTTGGVVYIKEGTYTISASITVSIDNVTIIGAGHATKLNGSGNITQMFNVTGDYFRITNIYLEGSGTTSTWGIKLSGSVDSEIDSCWINGFSSAAINMVSTSDRCRIVNNYFEDATTGLGISLNACANCIIIGNVFNISSDSGVDMVANADYNIVASNRMIGAMQIGVLIENLNCDKNLIHGNILVGPLTAIDDSGTLTTSADNVS